MAIENYEVPLSGGNHRYLKALAASDCLEGWFFALDVRPGASIGDIRRAYTLLTACDDDIDTPDSMLLAANAAFDQLTSQPWGRA